MELGNSGLLVSKLSLGIQTFRDEQSALITANFPSARIWATPAIGRGKYSSHIHTPAITTTYPALRLAWQMQYLKRRN